MYVGELSDGSNTFGSIEVPEVAYDTEFDDYVVKEQIQEEKGEVSYFILVCHSKSRR